MLMDDTLSILASLIWVLALGMWPVGFMFGMCSPCCETQCPWLINFDRCLRVAVVGSTKPEGWDCRVSPTNFIPNRVVARSLEIHNLPARIEIPIRVQLSSSGASRTPVGQTRSQTWRLNRAIVSDVSPYDVVGPPWFVEIEVEVEGVATDDDAGVTSFTETDAYGQPKLRLEIKQGPTTVTHTQQVQLNLIGLQRWFHLTEFGASATLVAGQAYSGWTVTKAIGITFLERKLGVHFPPFQTFCAAGGQGVLDILLQKTILDDEAAVAFLSGDEDVRLTLRQQNPTATLEVELRVLPANAMCEVWDFGTGVAAGVYPEKIYVEPSQQHKNLFPTWCAQQDIPVFALGNLSCANGWGPVFYVRGRSWAITRHSDIVTPQQFWPGRTLLWNIEHPPYRNQAVLGVIGQSDQWTYKLESAAEDDFWTRGVATCPQGMSLFDGRGAGLSRSIGFCLPTVGPFQSAAFLGQASITTGPPSFFADASFEVEIANVAYSGGAQVPMILVNTYEEDGETLVLFAGISESLPIASDPPRGMQIRVYAIGAAIGCEQSGLLNLSVSQVDGFSPNLSDVTSGPTFAASVPETLSYSHLLRFSCSDWDAQEIPPEGATVSRECTLSDGSEPAADLIVNFEVAHQVNVGSGLQFVAGTVPRSLAFSASSSYLPRYLFAAFVAQSSGSTFGNSLPDGSSPILQRPNCRMLRIYPFADPSNAQSLATPFTRIFASVPEGQCLFFVPVFGSWITPSAAAGGLPCQSQLQETTLPCNDCTPGVALVSGEENGTVRWIGEGDKAGTIEVVALRTWLGGQGVVFALTCGASQEIVTVRRADTPPLAPTGLTATRNPCDTVTLTWIAPHDGGQPIINYTVQYRPLGTSNWITLVRPNSAETTAAVPGLLSVGYEFRVAAVTSVGSGAFSAVLTLGFALGPPTNLTATRGPCTAFALAWTPPQQTECIKLSGYQVEYRLRNEFAWTLFSTVAGTASSATVTGLVSDGSYQFRVIGQSAIGSTGASSIVDAWTVPQTPSGVVATAGDGQVTLQWSGAEDPCQPNTYRIFFRPTSSTSLLLFGEVSAPSMTFVVTGLSNGIEYVFSVQARNAAGFSGTSNLSNPVTPTA